MLMNSAELKMAKIYTFPVRPKAASSAVRLARMEAEARRRAGMGGDFGSWYHQDAIEAPPSRGRG
ncbi:MAG: DUF2735 domain-containing protein [Hyphomicrobiaceae bacterium]